MTGLRILPPLAALLLAGACLPVTSSHSIGSTTTLAPDPALYGAWHGQAKDAPASSTFYFLRQKNGDTTALVVTAPGKNDDGSWGSFSVTTARLGANHFLNARQMLQDGQRVEGKTATATFPLLYRFGPGSQLTLYLLDEKKTAAAIAAGKLKGTVEKGDDGDVVITEDAASLDNFMAGKDGTALFGPPLIVLHKTG